MIDSRSFGDDRNNVTRKALFYMIGLENKGILAVAKHFPGHGDTDKDSHDDLPVIKVDRNRLDSLELFPYRDLIFNGLSGVMTAHLRIPAFESGKDMPASLSKVITDSLLRQVLQFKGLIFTDALNMKAISNSYKSEESAELAIKAGNDILLMPDDVPGVIEKIVKLIKKGDISQETIDTHCRRILAAKYFAGLNHYQPVELANLDRDLNKPEYRLLQRKLIGSALTVLQNRSNLLPLKNLDTLHIASLVLSSDRDTSFQQALGLYGRVDSFRLKGDGFDNLDSIYTALKKYNLVIASVHSTDIRSSRKYGISDCMIDIIDSLAQTGKLMLDVFANPYVLNRFHNLDKLKALVVSYENSSTVQELSAQLIYGAIGARGTLSVTAGNWKSLTSGMQMNAIDRLRFSLPLEAGMNEDSLQRINDILAEAISKQALPGCQVLVARHGMVIMNKSFGNPVYKSTTPVKYTDLYDLASVTKVVATTQAVMKLTDEGCLGIDQKLSAYLPYLDGTNKENMVIKDMLLHQAGTGGIHAILFCDPGTGIQKPATDLQQAD